MSAEREEKRRNEGDSVPYERRRIADPLLERLDQKVDDHIREVEKRFVELDDKLKPVVAFYESVKWPVQALVWSFITVLLAVLTAFGHWITEQMKVHWR